MSAMNGKVFRYFLLLSLGPIMALLLLGGRSGEFEVLICLLSFFFYKSVNFVISLLIPHGFIVGKCFR